MAFKRRSLFVRTVLDDNRIQDWSVGVHGGGKFRRHSTRIDHHVDRGGHAPPHACRVALRHDELRIPHIYVRAGAAPEIRTRVGSGYTPTVVDDESPSADIVGETVNRVVTRLFKNGREVPALVDGPPTHLHQQ